MKSVYFYLRVCICLAATIPVKSEIFHRKRQPLIDYDHPNFESMFNPSFAQGLQSTLNQGSRIISSPLINFNDRHASNNLASSASQHTVSTVTNVVPFGVPQPFPIHITRTFPTPVYVGVPYDVPRPVRVSVPRIVPYAVPRSVPVEIPRAIPVPHSVPIAIAQTVEVPDSIQVAQSAPIRIAHPKRHSFYIPGPNIPNTVSINFPDYAQPLYRFNFPTRHYFE